jgi:MFS transporter, PHS family, inorganic phosphate transporter
LLPPLALLTSAAGAVVFGRLADKLGRRKVYGYEVLVLAAGAIASACAPGIWWLIAFRGILGFGIGGDYPVSATIMSECASRHDRGRMVALVFSMQGAGLVIGPLVAIGLLKAGICPDHAWRIMLALGAIPALAVFWLRRRLKETPRFLLAQIGAAGTAQRAALGRPTGIRGVLAEPRLLRWLAGASLAWLLFDFVYYGNTISSPMIDKLVSPHASLIGATAVTLAIFAVAALPGYLLAAFTIDKIGRQLMQAAGFAVIAAAFGGLWLIPGATTTLLPFLLLFGVTYFFAEFGPNTTTFVYPAEIFPVRVRTTSHGIAAAAGKNRGLHRHLRADGAAPGHRGQQDQRYRGRRLGPRPARHGHVPARTQGHQPGRTHQGPPQAGHHHSASRPDPRRGAARPLSQVVSRRLLAGW